MYVYLKTHCSSPLPLSETPPTLKNLKRLAEKYIQFLYAAAESAQ